MSEVQYVHLNVDDFDDEGSKAVATALNDMAVKVAELHGMVKDIYAVFEGLKPMIGAMPKMPPNMPPGMMLPPGVPMGRRR